MVRELPLIDNLDQSCEGCLLGKHGGNFFSKNATTRAKKAVELIHANVCYPIHLNFFDKNKYFLLFIDDFSINTWTYFLKEKI